MPKFDARQRRYVGFALIAAAAAVNPWVVGWVATTDGSIDQVNPFALLLFVSGLCLLGGLQLLWGWVDRVSWVRPAGFLRGLVFVGLGALVIAGAYWRIASFQQVHRHTEVRPADIAEATPEQRQWAEDFYRRSLAAALKNGWFDYEKAMAQGFQPDRVNRTHYPNLEYMFDDVILDPERPEWLVYHDSPDGKVLMALMFFTRTLDEIGPMPGGPIAQWHYHPYDTPRCAIKGIWTVGPTDREGKCAEGIPVTRTPEMFHVWFIDHPLGRFTEMKIVSEYWQEERRNSVLRLAHPIAVHFAIALLVVAVVLDIAGLVLRRPGLHAAAWVNLALAALAAVVTVFAGFSAEIQIKPTPEAHETLDVHKIFGFSSLALILLLFGWRYALRGRFPARGVVLYVALSLTALGAVTGAGYFGGEMVYRHGAGVLATDKFLRERYWKLVQDVYRRPTPELIQQVMAGGAVPPP